MDHCDLLVVNTESLSCCKTFDSRQLIQQNDIFIQNVVVNGVQICIQDFVFDRIEASLLQAHVVDSAKDLEEVLYDVILFTSLV